ncbi:hypothetical protein BKA64DRAFT_37232 [Cadophora sp. MPI-SDFR-AT-0126]|nr:hypothetical protein BKA64DRAFT_37232 [Leotiomycetes sp. MPI-SDFR-AT-0126]
MVGQQIVVSPWHNSESFYPVGTEKATPLPPSLTHSIHSSDSASWSIKTEDGTKALDCINTYTSNLHLERFIAGPATFPWLDRRWGGDAERFSSRVKHTEDVISALDQLLHGKQSEAAVKTPLFDPLLQELDGMMDCLVFPARRPVPTGELKPWNLKTGLDTTQPGRSKGGSSRRLGVDSHSSKVTTSASLFTSSWLRKRFINTSEVPLGDAVRSHETSSMLASDAELGAQIIPKTPLPLSVDPVTPFPLWDSDKAWAFEPCRLASEDPYILLTCLPTVTGYDSRSDLRVMTSKNSMKVLGDDQTPSHHCDPSLAYSPFGNYDSVSAVIPHHIEASQSPNQPTDTTGMDSELPSLSYGSISLQDSLPSEVPRYVTNPMLSGMQPTWNMVLGRTMPLNQMNHKKIWPWQGPVYRLLWL